MRIYAAIITLIFTLAIQPAVAAEKARSHATGNFAIELNGSQSGLVQPVEGGHTTSEPVTPRSGLGAQPVTPAANLKTQMQPPHFAPLRQSPPCAKPPCTLPSATLKPATSTNAGLGGQTNSDKTGDSDADTDKKPE